MGQKRTAGLCKRNGVWHIDKMFRGRRICESTGSSDLAAASEHLARRLEEARQAALYGARPKRTFRAAATKYLLENKHKRSLGTEAIFLQKLNEFVGDLALEAVHM